MFTNNNHLWNADREFILKKTNKLVKNLNDRGLETRIGTFSEDLNGIDIVCNNHKIDLKFRRTMPSNDYCIELYKNDNLEKHGWACDVKHKTDFIMYIFADNSYAMFSFQDILTLGNDRITYLKKPNKCNFFVVKSLCPYSSQYNTSDNVTYQTWNYFAYEKEIGKRYYLSDLDHLECP